MGARGIPLESAVRYARFFRVTLEWLVLGRGSPAGDQTPGLIEVPRLSWVSAGVLQPHISVDSLDTWPTIEVSNLPDGDWIALDVQGSSMDRISPPDSTILVNRKERALVPNACYVIANEQGEATYKRYRPNPDRFEPVSNSTEHETIFPAPGEVLRIIGRVRRTMMDM